MNKKIVQFEADEKTANIIREKIGNRCYINAMFDDVNTMIEEVAENVFDFTTDTFDCLNSIIDALKSINANGKIYLIEYVVIDEKKFFFKEKIIREFEI